MNPPFKTWTEIRNFHFEMGLQATYNQFDEETKKKFD